MIKYRFPEEKTILLHYAEKTNSQLAKQILIKGYVEGKSEAKILSKFYWDMVDVAVDDEGCGVPVLEAEGVAPWMEFIFHSLNGYLVSNGYAEEWDAEWGGRAVDQDFKRYPHVRALIEHYAGQAKSSDTLNMLKLDSFSKEDAYRFGRFIVSMIDAMAVDMQSGVVVLGGVDNTEMIPDIDYEVRLFLADRGWYDVWDEICDQA